MLLQFRTKAIAPLETYALLCALQTWKQELKNKKVILLNDNQSVVFGLLKGSSADIFVRTGVQRIYNTLTDNGILASIRWVPSEYNVSDGLTREDLMPTCKAVLDQFAEKAGFEVSESVPDNGTWLECLQASHGACLRNGAKRPEQKPKKRQRSPQQQENRPKNAKNQPNAQNYWNDWEWDSNGWTEDDWW
jgi:hypothetical protein